MRWFSVLAAVALIGGCARTRARETAPPRPGAAGVEPEIAAMATCPRGIPPRAMPAALRGAQPWVRHYGGDGGDEAASVALHPSGDIIVTGQFSGEVAFGREVLASDGRSDAFVARLTPGGDPVWVRALGGPGSEFATAVAADSTGNVVVLGGFDSRMPFAGATLRARGRYDVFVASFSAGGDESWAAALGGPSWELAGGMAVDLDGDIVIAGAFEGSLHVGDQGLESAGDADAFVVRLAPDGRPVWSVRLGERGWDEASAVAVDSDGSAVVAGTLSAQGQSGGFVAKYSAQGEPVWVTRPSGSAGHCATAVAVAGDDSILVAGGFAGVFDPGGGDPGGGPGASALHSAGERDLYISVYDGGGRHVGSRRFGGSKDDCARAIAVGPRGDFVLVGAVSGDVSLGGDMLRAGHLDLFAARYTAGGEHVWSQVFPGAGAGARSAIMTAGGRVVVAGSFSHTLDLGGSGELKSVGGLDAFIAVLPATRMAPPDRR